MGRSISKKVIYFAFIIFLLFPFSSFNYLFFRTHILNYDIGINALADDTPDVDLDELPDINYDILNKLWYEPKIEMLIITPNGSEDFVDAVTPLMEWKNEKGVKTIILSNFSLYPGRDDPEKIRNMIKYYYETENVKWVLLAGDAQSDLVPIRYVYNPDVVVVSDATTYESEYSNWDDYYKPTDFYYADLTGSWDNNGNGEWGESSVYTKNKDEISWIPEIYVGRFPAGTVNELEDLVSKTLKYETDPYIGDWMNKMLLAGGISEFSPPEDEARLTTYIWQHYTITEMNFTHQSKTTSSYTPPTPPPPNQEKFLSQNNFRSDLNAGFSTVIFAGHGDPTVISSDSTTIYTNSDALSISNNNMTSLFYIDACTTAPYDKINNSIGEILIKKENAGAIGYIGGLRVNWYFRYDTNLEKLNRGNAKLFWKEFFENKKFQQGKALYDSKVAYMNSDYFKRGEASMDYEWERKNILTYNLLGDPEVDIYTNKPLNATNPFTESIYEGQLIQSIIRDIDGTKVPYARVHMRTNDGKYRTVYADIHGEVDFRVPTQANENYNVTITGHNLIPTYFKFTTLPDSIDPEFLDDETSPKEPTVSDNILFDAEVIDLQSGVQSVYLLQSRNDDFDDYEYYQLSNSFKDDREDYKCTIDKLDPGDYYFLILARDWANNVEILDDNSFKISIPVPLMDYILIIGSFMIVGIVGVSVLVICKKNKEYSQLLSRFEEI